MPFHGQCSLFFVKVFFLCEVVRIRKLATLYVYMMTRPRIAFFHVPWGQCFEKATAALEDSAERDKHIFSYLSYRANHDLKFSVVLC